MAEVRPAIDLLRDSIALNIGLNDDAIDAICSVCDLVRDSIDLRSCSQGTVTAVRPAVNLFKDSKALRDGSNDVAMAAI